MVKVIFITTDGQESTVSAESGVTLLQAAQDNGIRINSPCEGNLACGQCHVVIDSVSFSKLPLPTERELDVLDFIPNVTETSRLACQIVLTKELDGIIAKIEDF